MKKIKSKQKKIKESKILNDKLIKEKEEIIKELDNKKKLINEYELELNKINYEHKQKVQEMIKELNDKNISLNKYKENINKLDKEYKKEIQELKKELKESKEYIDSNKKDKDKVMKEFNKLYNERQNYIKGKQIIEQQLNKKEQELANNKKIINDLNIKIKSLKDDDKLMEDFKKDSLPKYNEKLNRSKNLKNEYEKIPNLSELLYTRRDPTKIKKLDMAQIEKKLKDGEFYEYELNISDSRIKYLDKIIKENPKMSAKKIDIINQLKSLYTTRKDYFKIKIYNPKS